MDIVVLNIAHSRFRDREKIAEFLQLVESNQFNVTYVALAAVKKPSPKTFVHQGTVDYLKHVCAELRPKYIVCSIALQARIQRNLEKALCVDFVDRTELLLSLFEKRATSRAGQLQVELARLSYMQTKLVRGWTHLERQRGGIGLRGGPGETQIEVDRRILRDNIHKIKVKLDKVVQTRQLNRKRRRDDQVFAMALVGYTNAGKSSLFNQLTHAKTWANDQLFATLDPLVRSMTLPDCSEKILLIDTVGFMRDLPEALVTAFRSTLEEILYCDLIVHVIDCGDHEMADKIASVESTLEIIGAQDIHRVNVFNKHDLNPAFHSRSAVASCVVSSLQKQSLHAFYELIKPLIKDKRS